MGEARSSLDVHSYAPAQCSGRAFDFFDLFNCQQISRMNDY